MRIQGKGYLELGNEIKVLELELQQMAVQFYRVTYINP